MKKNIAKTCNIGQIVFSVLITLNLLSVVMEFNSCGESNICLTHSFLGLCPSGKVYRIKALGGISFLLYLPDMVA